MPYADNQGVRIHFQVIGEGEPLLMQHGFFSTLEDWHEFGYVEKLSKKFLLIMVDARGTAQVISFIAQRYIN
jgi:pimeloyl-ACP methyl ester carboxylesterase